MWLIYVDCLAFVRMTTLSLIDCLVFYITLAVFQLFTYRYMNTEG